MSKSVTPIVSVVIPVFNEAENIGWFYDELSTLFKKIDVSYELIYINDGSTDATPTELKKLAKQDTHLQYVCLARNFGKEAATTAGIHMANGKAIIILDGDGQHPSDKIPEMIELWKKGYQHVVGIRRSNEKAGIVKTVGSKVFYFLARKMGATGVVANATDFRLIDRELAEAFKLYKEKKRMTRALLDWSGFSTIHMTFDARQRTHGVAAYNFRSLLRLALNGYIGSTLKPLYFIGILGLLITSLSLLIIVATLINDFIFLDALNLGVSGTAYIALTVALMVGLLMVSQGIAAAYIANIHLETQDRPLYIINKAKSTLR